MSRAARKGVIAAYFEQLPVDAATPVVTLGEGDTPLIHSRRLSDEVSADVWLKYEGLNPTGSFKDRGMTVAISRAKQDGADAVICASTGNTSASAAAYAGRAGLTCAVIVPRGRIAMGKLAQALVHGATVLEIEGGFDDALRVTRALAEDHAVTVVNSINPFRIEGQKTAAFEIVEALGEAPDLHLMPVGNAGNITAYWRGYREAVDLGWATRRPALHGFQAEGAAPIVRGHPIEDPQTAATAIRIGNPASWEGATEAAGDSGGAIDSVTEDEIKAAYLDLSHDGILVELASAASVAGLRKLARAGGVPAGSKVACVLTGHGLKDPDTARSSAPAPQTIEADPAAIAKRLGL